MAVKPPRTASPANTRPTRSTESDRTPVLIDARHASGFGATRGFGRYLRSLLGELALRPELAVSVLVTADGVGTVPAGIRPIVVARRLPGRFADPEHRVRLPFDIARRRSGVFHSAAAERPPWFCTHPWVHTIHDVPLSFSGADDSDEVRIWCRRRRRVRLADAVIVVSRYAAQSAIPRLGLDPARVYVAPLGVAATFSPPPERRPGTGGPGGSDPYLLFVADYGPHKGFAEAFDLIAALAERGLPHRLVHVGRLGPWSRPAVDKLLARAPRPDRIELAGAADDEALVAWYRGADALVVTSRAEGFGLPAVEAMACATPVVAFDNTALREVIGDGGLLIPDGEMRALTEAIARLMSDPERWRAASVAAHSRARAFSWAACAAAHAEVFNEAWNRVAPRRGA